MRTITKIIRTSIACPEQYIGILEDGSMFYIRCRFGKAQVRIGTVKEFEDWKLKVAAERNWYKDPLKGSFEGNEFHQLLRDAEISLNVPIEERDAEKFKFNMYKLLKAASEDKDQNTINRTVRQTAIFITSDEDMKRGKLEPSTEQEVMQGLKKKHKVVCFDPWTDDFDEFKKKHHDL